MVRFLAVFDDVFSTLEEGDWGELKDESGGNKDKDKVNKDNDTFAENVGSEAVEPPADDATILPDGGGARYPDNHQDAGDINRDCYSIIF